MSAFPNANSSTRRSDMWPLALLVLYGLLVRLPGLGTLPIWYDEALSYWSATRSWHDLWTIVPRYETHSVFFYSLLKLWTSFGTSELSLRAMPLLFDLLTIMLVYRAGKILGGRSCAVLAALLFASAPFQILQSQNIRPYTLLTLASAVTVYSALHIVRYQTGREAVGGHGTAYMGLSLGAALLLWSHNVGVLQVATVFAFLGYFWLSSRLATAPFLRVLAAAIAAALLYLPNLLILAMQFKMVSKGWWLAAPSFVEVAMGTTEIFGFPIYRAAKPDIILLNVAFIMPAIMLIGRLVRNGNADNPSLRRCMALLACLAFIPWAAAIIVTYGFLPIFLSRTLIMCQVPAILLISTVAIALRTKPRLVKVAAYAVFLTVPLVATALFYRTDRRAEETERVSKAVADKLMRSDARQGPVFVLSNSAALTLNYYLERGRQHFDVMPLPAPYPAPGFAYYPDGSRGTPGLDRSHVSIMAQHLGQAKQAWLLRRRADLYDPGNVAEGFLDRHFACKAFLIGSDDKLETAAIVYHGVAPGDCQAGEQVLPH